MSRKEIAEYLPEPLRGIVLLVGEVDLGGIPQIEFYKCLTVITAINYARKVLLINSPELVKAEGAESAHFMHFSELAGVEMD